MLYFYKITRSLMIYRFHSLESGFVGLKIVVEVEIRGKLGKLKKLQNLQFNLNDFKEDEKKKNRKCCKQFIAEDSKFLN